MKDFIQLQELIQEEILKLGIPQQPAELYDPIRYILSIGGKRLRPALLLMSCELFSDDIQAAIKPALGFEIFHNFTLLHDDIMDKSLLRRGEPAVHRKWNENIAILSGDAMSILAFNLLSKADDLHLKALLDLFNHTALQVCEGQQYDMNFEVLESVSVQDYLGMIELKTAVLIAASLKAGALIGGGTAEDAELMYEFGRNLGIAFQLRDDYLDVYGDQEKFGKKIGNDIVANKKTFLVIKALELSTGETHRELIHMMGPSNTDPEKKIRIVKEIFNQLDIPGITNQLTEKYYSLAMTSLEQVSAGSERKTLLLDLSSELLNREQ